MVPYFSSESDYHPSLPPQHKTKPIYTLIFLFLFSSTSNAAVILGHHLHSTTTHPPPPQHQNRHDSPYAAFIPSETNTSTACNIFVGTWILEESYTPLYSGSNCPVIDPQFDCQLYGRPDSDYLKYRWVPSACDGELTAFNGINFLERMRGRTVMFVGDSLGRNQWESLICMVSAGIPRSSPTQIFRGDPFSSFKFLEYEVTISFYKAPYLVDIDVVQGRRILRLGDISGNGNAWRGVDVLVFNTGHWWTHRGSLQGWDFMELNGRMFQDMDRLTAMNIGLTTWARWINSNIDPSRTAVFFTSISPTHDNPTEWGGSRTVSYTAPGKNCYGEMEPVFGAANGGWYPPEVADMMKVVTTVLSTMAYPPYLLDITMLSAMRKDAHPSIYSGSMSPSQRADPVQSSDCSHWCLPGLPDTWNQLFYTIMFF